MISSEVQRTLVKSPPELWAELSDPASLARHLGELGEIRITRTEPERTVEWEAADTTGKVLLKLGWGTKVTLTAAREVAAPEPSRSRPSRSPRSTWSRNQSRWRSRSPSPRRSSRSPWRSRNCRPSRNRAVDFSHASSAAAKEQASPQPSDQPETALESESPTAIEITELEPTPEDLPPPPEELPEDLPDIAAELKAAEEVATDGSDRRAHRRARPPRRGAPPAVLAVLNRP